MRPIEPNRTRPSRARAAVVDSAPLRTAAALPFLLVLLALITIWLAGCAPEGGGETIQVSGILTDDGSMCQTLTSEDGELYALVGELGEVQSGDLVEVTGTLGDEDECDGGIVFRVTTLDVVAGPNAGQRVGEPAGGTADDGMDDGTAEDAPVAEPGADGQLLLEGELTDEGVECQALRGDDGELYTLTGDLGELTTGDRVRVVATPVDVSTCQQGRTVEIVEIGPVEENGETAEV